MTAPCRAEPREGILEARTPVPPDRVSVIVPVKNEESSIAALLTSLIEQTVSPAEIVITDGGSRDRTRELVRQMQANSPIPIVLVETGDAFPGRGRNLAIRHATNDWIACIDAGIVAAPNWLEELVLVARAHPEASVIFGRYQAVTDSFFSKCAAIVYGPAPGDRGRTSIACCMMSRSVWERIGGFREDLRSAEDLVFFRALGDAGVKAAFSEALVRWTIPGDMPSTFKRFFVYSRYGVKAGLWKEWQGRVLLLYAVFGVVLLGARWVPALLVVPPTLLLLRAERRIARWCAGMGIGDRLMAALNPVRILTVAAINVVIDIAMFLGVLYWLVADWLGSVRTEGTGEGTGR